MRTFYSSIFITIVLLGMYSCSQDNYEVLKEDNLQSVLTRTSVNSDSIQSESTIIPLEVDSNLIKAVNMRKAYSSASYSTDEYHSSNMWNIRELPITLKSRGTANTGNQYLTSNGAGKEITLAYAVFSDYEKFYLKVLPSTAGVPYLIYSQQSNTPLAVGQYSNNPDNKVLFAQENESGSLYSAGWDLIPSTNGYFAIQSESYLGQTNPNDMWSVFNYALEIRNNNKVGYAQYSKKPQQEFLITLYDSQFRLKEITFDAQSAIILERTPQKIVTYGENRSQYQRDYILTNVYNSVETSYFGEISTLLVSTVNPDTTFYLPKVAANRLVVPNTLDPDSELNPNEPKPQAKYITTTTQNLPRPITFNTSGRAKPNSLIEITSYLRNYSVSAKYTVTLKMKVNGEVNEREIKLTGTWKGIVYTTDRPTDKPDVAKYFDLDDGSELSLRKYTLSPITFK